MDKWVKKSRKKRITMMTDIGIRCHRHVSHMFTTIRDSAKVSLLLAKCDISHFVHLTGCYSVFLFSLLVRFSLC